jgi:hypothetical protein
MSAGSKEESAFAGTVSPFTLTTLMYGALDGGFMMPGVENTVDPCAPPATLPEKLFVKASSLNLPSAP